MLPVTPINYQLDVERLLAIARNVRYRSKVYHHSMENWKWSHQVADPYFNKIKVDLKVKGWIDFYFQEPNSILVPHVDPKSLCAINFVLSKDPAPITFYENAINKNELGPATHYTYKQAILNTTLFHSVQTEDTERVLFKICIADKSYESVVKQLTDIGNVA